MGGLTLDLRPGAGLGAFNLGNSVLLLVNCSSVSWFWGRATVRRILKWLCVVIGLGMPVCEALAYVEQHRSFFDVVQVKYNDEVKVLLPFVAFPVEEEFSRLIQLENRTSE